MNLISNFKEEFGKKVKEELELFRSPKWLSYFHFCSLIAENVLDALEETRRFTFQAISNAFFAVDSFFLIGWVTTHSQQNEPWRSELFLQLTNLFARLTHTDTDTDTDTHKHTHTHTNTHIHTCIHNKHTFAKVQLVLVFLNVLQSYPSTFRHHGIPACGKLQIARYIDVGIVQVWMKCFSSTEGCWWCIWRWNTWSKPRGSSRFSSSTFIAFGGNSFSWRPHFVTEKYMNRIHCDKLSNENRSAWTCWRSIVWPH